MKKKMMSLVLTLAMILSFAGAIQVNAEEEEFKSLITDLETGKYTPEQAEDKCYAIIGRQAKAKRQSKVAPAPKVTINANHKEQPKTKDSKYGGLLFK